MNNMETQACDNCGALAPILFLRSHMGLCSSCDTEYMADLDQYTDEHYWNEIVTAQDLIEQGIWDEDIITCK